MIILNSFLVSVFVFFLFLITGLMLFKNKVKYKYNFVNHFPFELETKHTYPLINSFYALYSASIMILHIYCFFIYNDIHSPDIVNNAFVIILLIQDVLGFMLLNSRLGNSFKTHIYFASFYFAISLAANAYGVFYIIRSEYYSYFYLIYFIIAFILQSVLLLMPKIKDSFISSNKDNRGKYNHLAFSEWIFIFSQIAFNLIIVLIHII